MRNRLRVRLLLLGCWTLTCSAGCAGHSQFEQTARVTLGQTAAYQNEVDSKVAQENAYRSEMLGILQASADREEITSTAVLQLQRIQDFQAQVIKDGGRTQKPEVRDFSYGMIKAVQASVSAADQVKVAAATTLPNSVATVNAQSQNLTDVRHDLQVLQSGQSSQEELKNVVTFGQQVQQKVQQSGKSAK